MYKVLIVSIANFLDSTGEVPFLYKKAGCIVDVFCDKSSWLLTNRFHDSWIDSGDSNNESEFIELFLNLVKSDFSYYDKIVITDDATNKLFNNVIEDPILFKKILPLTKIENRKILSSKAGLSDLLNFYSIATPNFEKYHSTLDLEKVIQNFYFPIILKVDYSFSGIGLQLVEKPEDLENSISKVYDTNNMVMQEFIVGEDIGVEALFHDGKLIMYNCATILSYMYNAFSFTTSRSYYRDKKIESLLTELGEKIGLNGFASIQYVYSKERDIYYLIEVDIRTNSWMSYGRFTGQNFSDGIKSIIDPDRKFNLITEPKQETEKIKVFIFDRDIRRCFKTKDFLGLLKWVLNIEGRWKFIPLYDMKYFRRILNEMFFDFRHKIS